jgi:hypothetical protein
MSDPAGPPSPPPGQPRPRQPSSGDYLPPAGVGSGRPGVPVSNAKATASLVTGVASLVLSWCCGLGVAGVVAIVLGVKARAEIRASGGQQEGEGLALAGIVTGTIALVIGLVVGTVVAIAIVAGMSGEATRSAGALVP